MSFLTVFDKAEAITESSGGKQKGKTVAACIFFLGIRYIWAWGRVHHISHLLHERLSTNIRVVKLRGHEKQLTQITGKFWITHPKGRRRV
jgi:hypothetical protein